MLNDLPAACRDVLLAPSREGAMTMLQAFAEMSGQPVPPTPAPEALNEIPLADGTVPARLPRPRPVGN